MKTLAIRVSDPWDWVTENGSGPFTGQLVAISPEWLLARLDKPIVFYEAECHHVLAGLRHVGASWAKPETPYGTSTDMLPIHDGVQLGDDAEDALIAAIKFGDAWRRGFLLASVNLKGL